MSPLASYWTATCPIPATPAEAIEILETLIAVSPATWTLSERHTALHKVALLREAMGHLGDDRFDDLASRYAAMARHGPTAPLGTPETDPPIAFFE